MIFLFVLQAVITNQFQTQCQKMGDYCFDPQIGLYEKGTPHLRVTKPIDKIEPLPHPSRGIRSSVDDSMVDCKDKSFFNFFCRR